MARWSAGRRWWLVIGSLLLLVIATTVAIYVGLYNIAADVPHTPPVYWLLETVRDRSVTARARDIVPNDLDDANRISKGAGQYAEMCSGCHLAPGMKRTEISRGLYPRAPVPRFPLPALLIFVSDLLDVFAIGLRCQLR